MCKTHKMAHKPPKARKAQPKARKGFSCTHLHALLQDKNSKRVREPKPMHSAYVLLSPACVSAILCVFDFLLILSIIINGVSLMNEETPTFIVIFT